MGALQGFLNVITPELTLQCSMLLDYFSKPHHKKFLKKTTPSTRGGSRLHLAVKPLYIQGESQGVFCLLLCYQPSHRGWTCIREEGCFCTKPPENTPPHPTPPHLASLLTWAGCVFQMLYRACRGDVKNLSILLSIHLEKFHFLENFIFFLIFQRHITFFLYSKH